MSLVPAIVYNKPSIAPQEQSCGMQYVTVEETRSNKFPVFSFVSSVLSVFLEIFGHKNNIY